MSDDAESGKWLKVKARMPTNAKVLALSDAAFRLHISVSCWCCEEMTDGHFADAVPAGMPKAPQGKKLDAAIAELVSAGLWLRREGGYEVNDFLKYNMSRAQYEAKREAGRTGGQRSGEVRRGRSGRREAPAEAPASPRASAPAQPPPEHENEYDQRSKTPPPKDLIRQSDPERPMAAAAELDFSELSIGDQAVLILENPQIAGVFAPHAWPEVIELARLGAAETGREVRLLPYAADETVRALVTLLARHDFDRLREALPRLLRSAFWLEKPGRPLWQLTPKVLDKFFADDAEQARAEALRQADRRRSTVPRKTKPEAAGISFAEFLKGAESG